MNDGLRYWWLNDTYSFGGSSGRAEAFPVTGYALYARPKKGERTALPPGEPDRPFPVGSLV